MELTRENLKQLTPWLFEIPKSFRSDMRVPARVYATEKMLSKIFQDRTLNQLVNLTTLPGIYKYALVMPDAHEGYGSPIGGVVAIDVNEGIISPGMCGYDINCGVRLLRSNFTMQEIKPHLAKLNEQIFREVPSGVGRGGRFKVSIAELDKVLEKGALYFKEKGIISDRDTEFCESNGFLEDADAAAVSENAKRRGRDQLGTIGAGNHFIEIQKVEKVFDPQAAAKLGLSENLITVMVHCGSRGLGHQIATDYIRIMVAAMEDYRIKLPDIELAAAPFSSKEGQRYFKAMKAGANFAFANRSLIMREIHDAFSKIFGSNFTLDLIYDVCHNIIKVEEYDDKKLLVHRKGATRAFPAGNKEIPVAYQGIGQPVIIPGSMGTASYILVGQQGALKETFGSTCHGAGRTMSRAAAKRKIRGSELKQEMEKQGIVVAAGSMAGLAEEAAEAYKNVDEVVDVVEMAGIAQKTVRLKPIGVVKG